MALIVAATINIGNPQFTHWALAKLFIAAGALLGSSLGPSWLRKALSVAGAVIGGFQVSVGRTPSTFPGAGSNGFSFQGTLVKPPHHTLAARYEIIFHAVWLAGEALRNKQACRDVVGGANYSDRAADILGKLAHDGRITYDRSLKDFGETMGQASNARIRIGVAFFDPTALNSGEVMPLLAPRLYGPRQHRALNLEETQVLTILHELGHASLTGTSFHRNHTEVGKYDAKIVKACL